MKSFSQGRSFFGLLTSSMLVLTSHALFATVSVTSDTDNGSGAPGTLSAAINSVNATPSNGPISIEPDSLSITGPMPSITTSLSIEPSTSSGSCSITATASSYNLTTIAGTTTLTPGVALGTGFVVDSGATLLLQGPNNWISTTEGFTLNNATLEFAYIYDQPVYQVYAGPIAISGASTISIPHSQDTTHASILMTGVISGNGPLTFEGQSFGLQSSGQNTWSGGTILNNGYIMVFTSQSLPSGTNITLEGTGTLSFSLSNTATYSGGSINATRSSTCGVEFNGGTCTFTSLSNIFSVLQSAGSVTVLGSTSVNNYLVTGGVLTLSGDLGGPGNLSVFGGLVILEGANNDFSGQLDLGGGTLQLNTLSSFGGAKLNLGGGIFYLNAPGNLWTSACGFSGSTTIQTASGSTLAFPALEIASFEASSTLAITGSGTVAIDAFSFSPQFVTSSDTYQSVNLTVDGVLGGTGGLSLTNTDTNSGATFTLILSDVNTYSGATSVGNGCALEVSSGASFGTSSDDVTIAAGASLTNSGNIGADTFTNSGTVTVNSGSNITVATLFKNEGRGTVSGCGTITGNYNTVGGTYPGCSPSPLTITGDATFGSGALVSSFLSTEGVAALEVGGNVTLDSDVALAFRPERGCYLNGEQHRFLSAGGTLTGTFSSVDMGTLLLTPHISYDSQGATLTIQRTPLASIVTGSNAQAVAGALDIIVEEEIGDGNFETCNSLSSLMFLSQEGISAALNQMQPSLFTALTMAQEDNLVKVQDALSYRMEEELDTIHCMNTRQDAQDKKACPRAKRTWALWATGMGDSLHQDPVSYGSNSATGYQNSMGGAVLGLDYHFAGCLYAGLLGAYTDSSLKWDSHQGKGTIQSANVGVYFSALGEMFYGNASVVGSWNHYNVHRNINLPEESFTANNTHGGTQLLSHIDTGINLGWKWFTLRPFDSFDYITQVQNAFTESGAGSFDLSVQKNNAIMLRNELGLSFASCFCSGIGKWTLSPKISWVREIRIKGANYTATFAGTDDSFEVTGYFPDRSLVSPGVNLTSRLWDDFLCISLYYNGEFNGQYSNHNYGAQVRLEF